MKFKRYPSIENSYRTKTLTQIDVEGIDKTDWVVLEKVHGSNFSIWVDENEVKFAKRSSFIGTDNFYDINTIRDGLEIFAKRLFDDVKLLQYTDHRTVDSITICGELFGGAFKHPEVKNLNVKQIQKGIYYSPKIEFMAFDLMINEQFVSHDLFTNLMTGSRFFLAPVLFKGSLKDCLNYPNEYDSKIPLALGLPHLTDNVCEGNVIKPNIPQYFKSGERVILKNKNEKWSEKSKERKSPKPEVKLSVDTMAKLESALTYITENRLKNVLSKIGEVTQKDFGKILGLMAKDVLEDYEKDSAFLNLEKNEDKLFKKVINSEVANLIRSNFTNIVDGNF